MANERRVAVVINPRAQGATAAMIGWLRTQVPAEDLFVPTSAGDARATIGRVVERGYDVLVTGGGDGLFMDAAAELIRLAPATMPALLPLRLGTGNAVHDVTASSPPTRQGLARDLARARDPRERSSPLRLLDVDGRITQFTGVGLDADWAADYAWLIKRHVGNGRLLPLVRGGPGYLATAFGLTIPRLIRRPFVAVKLIAVGGAARLDGEGRPTRTFADGAVVYEGPATLACASTVPSYSAGFRFFTNVDRIGDAFEIKVGIASPFDVVRHVRHLLGGGRDDERVLAFSARGLRVELPTPARYHVGGDVLAATRRFTIALAPRTVPVLRPGRLPSR